MTSRQAILLSIHPDRLYGCRASLDAKGLASVETAVRHEWAERATPNLTDKQPEIEEVLRALAEGGQGAPVGAFCIHPVWVLAQEIETPNVKGRELQDFLSLQVERKKAALRNGDIAWDYTLAPAQDEAEGRTALSFICRAGTIQPVADAFAACGIPLALGVPSSICDFDAKSRRTQPT